MVNDKHTVGRKETKAQRQQTRPRPHQRSAFDSIELTVVLDALHEHGINAVYVNLIEELKTGHTTHMVLFNEPRRIIIVRLVHEKPRTYNLTIGLRRVPYFTGNC
ncbi:unnamed protein product [Soboliphyme baturini]|uniref:DUF4258 domain-containing protein n=1 Tax=Soboliphyme baturini TaxID=241478 RepID=A0A183IKP0_9BILA|nr:unnamed protein product [Soboliphyme baturini]